MVAQLHLSGRRTWHHCLFSVATIFWLSLTNAATAEELLSTITVEADYFELRIADEEAYFQGNVEVVQGSHTFKTSQLTLHLDQINGGAQNPANQNANAETTNPLAYELSANQLSYNLAEQQINGSGDSELRRGSELIQADQIRYAVHQQVAYGIPDAEDGRVRVRFMANPAMPVFAGRTRTTATLPATTLSGND